MKREVWVDEDICISCGLCAENLPNVFRMADNGKAECYNAMGASEEKIMEDAVSACPVSCINYNTAEQVGYE